MSEVVSMAGIHCIGGDRDGYSAFLDRIQAAGRRPSLIKVRDDLGAVDEPLQRWPDVMCIGAFTEFDRLPFDYNAFKARAILKPQIRIWEVLNEDDSPVTYSAKTDLYISLAPLFKSQGWGLGMFNCGSGNPPYPSEDGGMSYREIARACRYMLDNNIEAYVCLHEYQSAGGTIGRFKTLSDYLKENNAWLPIVVTEYGFETHPGDAQFMQMIQANDPIYMRERVPCATWTLGGSGWQGSNFETALPELGEYIATVQPVQPPPVDEWEFVGHFNADTGALITNTLDYEFDLMADVSIDTRYQKKVPPLEMYTFSHKVTPPELAARVSVTPVPGTYPRGQRVRIVAS